MKPCDTAAWPLAEGDDGELVAGGVPEPLHGHGEAAAEHGDVVGGEGVRGQRRHAQQPRVRHLAAAAAAQHGVVVTLTITVAVPRHQDHCHRHQQWHHHHCYWSGNPWSDIIIFHFYTSTSILQSSITTHASRRYHAYSHYLELNHLKFNIS